MYINAIYAHINDLHFLLKMVFCRGLEVPYELRPVSWKSSPQSWFLHTINTDAVETRLLPISEGGPSTASFLHSSFLQVISTSIFWDVLAKTLLQALLIFSKTRKHKVNFVCSVNDNRTSKNCTMSVVQALYSSCKSLWRCCHQHPTHSEH